MCVRNNAAKVDGSVALKRYVQVSVQSWRSFSNTERCTIKTWLLQILNHLVRLQR